MSADLSTVTHVLSTIAAPPALRSQSRPGDLQGEFSRWFDGGAIKFLTGWSEYHFADGTVAIVPTVPSLRVDIRLPAGAYLSVSELSEAPPSFALCAV